MHKGRVKQFTSETIQTQGRKDVFYLNIRWSYGIVG